MSLLSVRDLRVSFGAVAGGEGHQLRGAGAQHASRWSASRAAASRSPRCRSSGLLPHEARGPAAEILFEGRNIPGRELRGAQISMIFQEPMSSLNPVFSVGFQIGEALREHSRPSRRRGALRTLELLEEVGLSDPEAKLDRYPFQLSGGEQQRVMIAMAIACEPKLLIADEPTSALDVTVQKQILELIAALQRRRRMSMLFITHDLALVQQVAEQVVVMRAGRDPGAGQRSAQVFGVAARRLHPHAARRPAARMDAAGADSTFRQKPFWRHAAWPRASTGVQAVKGASFKLARGRTLGLVGESGSGKTTLGLLVTRLHPASGGELRFHGEDAARGAARSRSSAPCKSCSRTPMRRSIRASASARS